jgi:hypothetical protein
MEALTGPNPAPPASSMMTNLRRLDCEVFTSDPDYPQNIVARELFLGNVSDSPNGNMMRSGSTIGQSRLKQRSVPKRPAPTFFVGNSRNNYLDGQLSSQSDNFFKVQQ